MVRLQTWEVSEAYDVMNTKVCMTHNIQILTYDPIWCDGHSTRLLAP
jgi:hypothetical protein